MNNLSEKNKKTIKFFVIIAIFILVIATIVILFINYNTKGETNLPFKVSSIKIVSTAKGDNQLDTENKWNLNVIQTNDVYFFIEKNPDYSKEDSIVKVTFNNFVFNQVSNRGSVGIYRPSTDVTLYNYADDYKVNNELSYIGALSTNIPSLEISNQGGMISFSVALSNLGNYISNDEAEIIHDGTLLSKLNLQQEDINMNVSFDMIIETASGKRFKATFTFDLPTGNILQDGKSILHKENFDDIVFKRV